MGYRIVIEANSSLRKKFRKELVKLGLDENANEIPTIWKRRKSNANKIILYDFGSRGFAKTEKSIFVLSVRQILEDHQMFYSFKCWLQKYQAVSLLNFVHKFEDFNRRFFGHVEFREEELQSFHKELSNLMDVHFSKGPCCIPISSKIIEGPKLIAQLRNSNSLFRFESDRVREAAVARKPHQSLSPINTCVQHYFVLARRVLSSGLLPWNIF